MKKISLNEAEKIAEKIRNTAEKHAIEYNMHNRTEQLAFVIGWMKEEIVKILSDNEYDPSQFN